MNREEQLEALIGKKEWTEEESRFVLGYLESGQVGELSELLKKRFESSLVDINGEDDSRVEEMWQDLRGRLQNRGLLQKAPDENISIGFRKRYRWIAAASLFIGITAGAYWLNQRSAKIPQTVDVVSNKPDVAPGGNKAILTLSNGTKIILDSAHNGLLARQSGSTVVKTDSGKLTYNASTEKPGVILFNTLSTPRGGQYQLTLPDGTKVWLNAASSITYPTAFIGKDRKVSITGEAYFEVVHNDKMPFRVQSGDQTIEDIGTSFNVNAYADESAVHTTLLEGSIKISVHGQHKTIVPGEQAITGFNSKSIDIDQHVNVDKVMAWRNGKIAITDVSVQQLMTEISRWYDVDIEYAGAVPNKQFYGSIRRDVPLSTVLHALEAYGIKTEVDGKKVIVQ